MTERRMNGFDAYENAWDVMAKRLWDLLGYNLIKGCLQALSPREGTP
jgi:hypothetical protein